MKSKEIRSDWESPNGWKKELNFVSWNERAPKFDIRDWEPGYKKWEEV